MRAKAGVAIAIAGVALVAAAGGGLVWASHTGRPAAVAHRVAGPAGRVRAVPAPKQQFAAAQVAAPPPAPAAVPTGLSIPAIGVHTSSLISLGLAADGTLQVPSTTTVAGWYTGGPRPGDLGAAVIAGHVDSYQGPGIFFNLKALQPGDLVTVSRADGSTAVFRVTSVQQYSKDQFPTEAVYGAVPDSELRLITCGGTFDAQTGHYLSNVIVSAVLDHTTPAPAAG